MKVIRFWTTHPEKSPEGWRETLCLDPRKYALVYEPHNPDYLLATEQIYTNASCRREFIRRKTPQSVCLFFAGESIFPDMNIFDYAVAFDKKFILDDRVCRFPTLDFYRKSVFLDNLNAPRFNAIEALRNKTGFCSFIYSNPKAHPNRDLLFNKMSEYRRVDSLGPHLNNVGTLGSRSSENWRQEAIEMKRPYKFSIASENATYNGYATEKILSSFQAYSVPIYWGDPSISAEFNPKAFVDANAYDSFDEVVEIVKEIDQNDDIWLQMVSAPIMTEEQMTLYREDHGKYVDFIDHIFNPDISDAKRAPSGFWTDNYFDWFRRCGMRSSFIRSILAGLRGS